MKNLFPLFDFLKWKIFLHYSLFFVILHKVKFFAIHQSNFSKKVCFSRVTVPTNITNTNRIWPVVSLTLDKHIHAYGIEHSKRHNTRRSLERPLSNVGSLRPDRPRSGARFPVHSTRRDSDGRTTECSWLSDTGGGTRRG